MSGMDRKRKAQQTRDVYAKQKTQLRSGRAGIDVPDIVDAIPFDLDGLMPVSALAADIKVTIRSWLANEPPPGWPEQVVLEWRHDSDTDYKRLLTKEFTTPYVEGFFPLELQIEQVNFEGQQGLFHLRYGVNGWSDQDFTYSSPVAITLDRTPPWGAKTPPALAVHPSITDATLAAAGGVLITIPDFDDTKKEFTRVAIEWSMVPPNPDRPFRPAMDVLLPIEDQTILLPRHFVDDLGSGIHYVEYTLTDKAGNISRKSDARGIPVALGALPENLRAPTVPLADDNGVIDLLDAHMGVEVVIPLYDNHEPRDQIVVRWGGSSLLPASVGERPLNPLSIPVVWQYLNAEYTVSKGPQTTPVTYSVVRGATAFLPTPADGITVAVDFSATGPVNPIEPDPTNPDLGPAIVTGNAGNVNHLIEADDGLPASVTVPLYQPLTVNDAITVYWNGAPIANTYTITGTETADIKLEVTWAEIVAGKPGPAVPVYYTLTHPDFINDQHSGVTHVNVEAVSITLKAAEYIDAVDTGGPSRMLNCGALRKIGTEIGYRVHVPPSEYLVGGNQITIEWHLQDSNFSLVSGSEKTQVLEIGSNAIVQGIDWLVSPYADHILPSFTETTSKWAYGITTYTLDINGKPFTADPVSALVGIANLSPGFDTCDLSIVVIAP